MNWNILWKSSECKFFYTTLKCIMAFALALTNILPFPFIRTGIQFWVCFGHKFGRLELSADWTLIFEPIITLWSFMSNFPSILATFLEKPILTSLSHFPPYMCCSQYLTNGKSLAATPVYCEFYLLYKRLFQYYLFWTFHLSIENVFNKLSVFSVMLLLFHLIREMLISYIFIPMISKCVTKVRLFYDFYVQFESWYW